jgi:flagellar basal body-associated protein FliL
MSDLKKIAISLMVMGIIVAGAIAAYKFRDDIKIERFIFNKQDVSRRSGIYVRFIVTASIDDKTLRLRFLVPCQDIKQRDEILGKLPVIQHEMIMTLSRPEMTRVVEKRSFSTMKKYMLKSLNNHSDKSIKKLYLENWFYN